VPGFISGPEFSCGVHVSTGDIHKITVILLLSGYGAGGSDGVFRVLIEK
jgi:hypothetical protein